MSAIHCVSPKSSLAYVNQREITVTSEGRQIQQSCEQCCAKYRGSYLGQATSLCLSTGRRNKVRYCQNLRGRGAVFVPYTSGIQPGVREDILGGT
jgi:hypothetical protein